METHRSQCRDFVSEAGGFRMFWWDDFGQEYYDLGGLARDMWIFVNLEGKVELSVGREVQPLHRGLVATGHLRGELKARFKGLEGESHQFLWLSISHDWIRRWMSDKYSFEPKGILVMGISDRVKQAIEAMMSMKVEDEFLDGWYQAKALEIAISVLSPTEQRAFYERHARISHERVQKVKSILGRDLENPPALPELSKEVGCSPHYLSRIFSQETGTTISRYLRDLRLDRAAEILKEGKSNVTEAAMEVGYSSLSHFSKAFAGRFGVSPCVFPLSSSPPPEPKQKLPVAGRQGSGSRGREPQKSR